MLKPEVNEVISGAGLYTDGQVEGLTDFPLSAQDGTYEKSKKGAGRLALGLCFCRDGEEYDDLLLTR